MITALPRLLTPFLLVLGGGLLAACPWSDDTPTEGSKEHQTVDEARAEAKEKGQSAARAVREYSYAQKDQLVAEMNEELADIQAQIDRLSTEVEATNGEAKLEAERKLEAVRERWRRAKDQLEAAQAANEETWEEVKSGFADTYDELHSSLDESRQWLSTKIAP
ncbi:MAG: hypothetical protein AB1Z98_24195 [Nannocystaceae bacterium]